MQCNEPFSFFVFFFPPRARRGRGPFRDQAMTSTKSHTPPASALPSPQIWKRRDRSGSTGPCGAVGQPSMRSSWGRSPRSQRAVARPRLGEASGLLPQPSLLVPGKLVFLAPSRAALASSAAAAPPAGAAARSAPGSPSVRPRACPVLLAAAGWWSRRDGLAVNRDGRQRATWPLSRREEVCHGRKCSGGSSDRRVFPHLLSPGIPCSGPGDDGYGSDEAGALLSPQVRGAPGRAFLFPLRFLALKSTAGKGLFTRPFILTLQLCLS